MRRASVISDSMEMSCSGEYPGVSTVAGAVVVAIGPSLQESGGRREKLATASDT
jgi:hypothetical protein